MSTNQTLRTGGIAASRDYQELPAWTKSLSLAERIYALSDDFPEREHAGLSAQMRSTVLAVASHIAAGSAKHNENGISECYSASQGAAAELTTQLTLATRLGYIAADNSAQLIKELEEVSRLLIGLKHGLKVEAKENDRAQRDATKAANEAAAERSDRPRREYKPRDGGDDRPRREYKPRDGGSEAPRREYKPRDSGGEDRPRREYKPRDSAGGDAPRREFKPRDSGDRPAYGEKKPYGDRKPYGDKKPYGAKKPFGDKKPYGDRKPAGKTFRPKD